MKGVASCDGDDDVDIVESGVVILNDYAMWGLKLVAVMPGSSMLLSLYNLYEGALIDEC